MNHTTVSFRGFARLFAAGFILLTLLCAFAVAQETTGGISGTVTDPSGAAVPNAKVEITGTAIPRPLTLVTDAQGEFHFQQVPAGMFNMEVTAPGFRSVKKNGIPVVLGRVSRVDAKLEVGQVSETVVVNADAVMVDTTSSSSAINVDKSFFDLIPKGRSFYDLIGIAPGARNEAKAGGYEVDGASGSENTYYLDGMEVTSIQTGVLSAQNKVPVEMVQQVQVKNGVMEAQYGGALGGVVNAVGRSGSNEFHGEVGFYFDNSAMKARPRPTLQYDPNDPDLLTSQYFQWNGDQFSTWNPIFTLGGPIVKNKLFFFAGYMPIFTNTDRTVNFLTGETATYNQKYKQDYLNGKLDYAPFTKLRTSFGWTWNPNKNTGLLPNFNGQDAYSNPWGDLGNRTAGNILNGQIDYLASAKMVISFRGGYTYTNYNNNYGIPPTTAVYYSNSTVNNTSIPADLRAPAGWVSQATAFTAQDTYRRINLNADLSYIANWHGQHSIKGGWQMNELSNDVISASYPYGYYRYYWNLTYKCQTSQCTSGTGPYGYYRYRDLGTFGNASSNNQALFIQDNWKVNKYLAINIGIRTEREFVPSFSTDPTIPSQAIVFNWPQKFSPRLGFSWDVQGNGKQRVYASWGWFYDIMKYELPRGSFGGDIWKEYYYALDDPNLVKTNQGRPADPFKLPGKFFEVVNFRIPSNDPSKALIDPNLKPIKQQMLDIGYEYSVSPTLVASARYTHRNLIRTIEDIGYEAPDGETYNIGNPGFGTVASKANWLKWMGPGIPTTPKAVRNYDAIEIRLDKRFAQNYQFAASYTYSRLWGNYSGLASSDEDGRTSPNVNRYFDEPWVSVQQNGQYAYGRLATDRPNTFKLFGAWSHSGRFGGTTIAPNIQLYSGTPITTEASLVSSLPSFPYGRGDLGRTPFYSNFDINFQQNFTPFKAHENMKMRFEFTVFNLFNQSTVTNIYKTMVNANYGQINFYDANGDTDYKAIFKGFNAKGLMAEQELPMDPNYAKANGFQAPRTMRLQLSFVF
jgi:hypothetical protein